MMPFQCCVIARLQNEIYNCVYYGLDRECGTTAAEFYAKLYSITAEPQLAAMNCSLTGNFFTSFILNCQKLIPVVVKCSYQTR